MNLHYCVYLSCLVQENLRVMFSYDFISECKPSGGTVIDMNKTVHGILCYVKRELPYSICFTENKHLKLVLEEKVD